jgi:hypothetical protein
MAFRFFAFALAALALTFAVLATAMNAKSAYAADDRWYVGEGAKQDTYVKYQIQEFYTADRQPFMMTIYFKEKDADGMWVAPTWIEYDNHVYKGTLKLGSNLARLAGGSGIPGEMNQFLSGYERSLQWLEAFTPQEQPKSLSDPSWGKPACAGCEEIKPLGKESVTVPAGTYDTTVVGWHSGQVDNKIWILNEFPYPVKAQTYANVTTGEPATLFKFDLMETGNGEPQIMTGTDEAPKSPIERQTTSGNYLIKLEWDSDIRPNAETSFGITFTDKTHFPLQDVDYDLTIKDVDGKVIEQLKNKKTDVAGIDAIPVKFNSSGPATISIKINSIEGKTTGQVIESADFGVVVVPEFPVSAAIVAAVVISLAVMITRVRGTGWFGAKDTSL